MIQRSLHSCPVCPSSFSTEKMLTSLHVFCPSLQKSDHGQVLLDAVFKHLELTERDYFGLHLADDSLDTPVSMMFLIYGRKCVKERSKWEDD